MMSGEEQQHEPRGPEEFCTSLIDGSPVLIISNAMPPRDPDEDDEDDEEEEEHDDEQRSSPDRKISRPDSCATGADSQPAKAELTAKPKG